MIDGLCRRPTIDLARAAFWYPRSSSAKRPKRNARAGRIKIEKERQTEEGGKEEGKRKDERERERNEDRGERRKREREDILFLAAPLCTSQKPVSRSPRSTKETDNFRQGFLREEKYVYIRADNKDTCTLISVVEKRWGKKRAERYMLIRRSEMKIPLGAFPRAHSKVYDKSRNY